MILRSAIVILLLALPVPAIAQDDANRRLEREIFAELININTSDSAGHTRQAAEAMARRLLDAGFPSTDVQVLGREPKYQNLVARYRGSGRGGRPILLMAHLDVVDARREDWSFDPYAFKELDGHYYGRGTSDNKAGCATLIANFIRLRREGFAPDRDLVIVLTADEETSGDAIRWLVTERRDLVDAEFALNTDAGGGEIRDGTPTAFGVQTAEKVYQSFQLEVRNKGGHSSVPEPDNAIYRLSAGLTRLAGHEFPVRLNETTRALFQQIAATQPAAIGADMRAVARNQDPSAARRLSTVPYYNSVMRTTCVATRLLAGHADNALPQLATALVNCRMLPDDPVERVQAELVRVLGDTAIHLARAGEATPSPASPLRPDVFGPVERLVQQMWPGAAVVPEMSTGATDGLYVRNAGIPVYGLSAIFERIDDIRAHGRDERVGVKAFHDAVEFWYRLLQEVSRRPPGA